MSSRLGLALIFVAVGLAYSPVLLEGEFVYDDFRFVKDNEDIRSLSEPGRFFTDPSTMTADFDRDIYRPLRTLSFAIDWALFGEDARGYHAINVLWHLLATVALWALLRHRFSQSPERSLAGAALFALHPLATESVAWITSRGDVASGALVLIGAYLHLGPSRRWVSVAGFGLVLSLALLSKESGATLLLACAASHVLSRSRPSRAQIADLALGAAIAVAYVWVRKNALAQGYPTQVPITLADAPSRFAWDLSAFLTECRLLIWPFGLLPDYRPGWVAPPGWLRSVGALAIIVLGVAWAWRRAVRPSPSALGLGLLAGAVLTTSHVLFGVKSLVAERFLYLGIAGLVMFIASLATVLPRSKEKLALASLVGLAILGGTFTFMRTREWRTPETLWTAALDRDPDSVQAMLGVAATALEKGETSRAVELWDRVIRQAPKDSPKRWTACFLRGRSALDEGDEQTALKDFEDVVARASASVERHNLAWYPEMILRLADIYRRHSRYEEAVEALRHSIDRFGATSLAWIGVGQNEDLAGRPAEAARAFAEALKLAPQSPTTHFAMGGFHLRHGRTRQAREAFERVLSLEPSHSRARSLLDSLR